MQRVELSSDERTAIVHAAPQLNVDSAGTLYETLRTLSRKQSVERVVVDFADVVDLDTAGVTVITLGIRLLREHDKTLAIENLRDRHREAFALVPQLPAVEPPSAREHVSLAERTGARAYRTWDSFAETAELIVDTLATALRCLTRRERMPRGSFVEQAVRLGADAFAIVALLSVLMGIILSLQSAYQLQKFGAEIYVADLLGLSMVREFGPFLTAIILTGRSGAALAAELGTMQVRDEVAALETMGVGVSRYLVLPRIAALTVVQPALSLLSMALGISGGMFLLWMMDTSAAAFWNRMIAILTLSDVWVGLSKSLVFAWIIGFTGIASGLRTKGAATSVGRSTTRAVVTSIFLIIVADSIFATLSTTVQSGG